MLNIVGPVDRIAPWRRLGYARRINRAGGALKTAPTDRPPWPSITHVPKFVLTLRWRGVDSNFQYAGAVLAAVADRKASFQLLGDARADTTKSGRPGTAAIARAIAPCHHQHVGGVALVDHAAELSHNGAGRPLGELALAGGRAGAQLRDCHNFLRGIARELAQEVQGFTPAAMEAMLHYRRPGNVRELIATMRCAVVLANGGAYPSRVLPLCVVAQRRSGRGLSREIKPTTLGRRPALRRSSGCQIETKRMGGYQ